MILTFGTYDAERHPRVSVLAAGLRAHGAEVTELNRPLGFSTAERVRMLQQPWRLPLLVVRLLACWAGLVAGAVRLRRTHGRPDAVLVGYLGHFDVVLARVLFPRSVVVLDHLIFAGDTAVDRGAAGLRVRLLNVLDRVATSCADVVVTDTDEHRAMLPDPSRGVTVLVGAPTAWFDAATGPTAPGEDAIVTGGSLPTSHDGVLDHVDGAADTGGAGADGRLRVVFFGLYTPLQGARVIAEAIRDAVGSGARLDVTMIGSGQDLAAAREILAGTPDVTWHDWVEPADLPALVAGHDVCLGIFSDTPKGLRVVPNKVYQGLAAGCVVVTSDTPPQRRAVGDAAELVPPADPHALAKTLTGLTDPSRLAAARTRAAAGRDAIRPQAVVTPLLTPLTIPAPTHSPPSPTELSTTTPEPPAPARDHAISADGHAPMERNGVVDHHDVVDAGRDPGPRRDGDGP
ncbi:glycosyltransferase [Myceligenerans xiligouense]|uniref:Glycosyl transferase family 1 n=1 Tax=Myceligenerans xiligouense TaxID=253184 RepID=A0A3N4Z259_9MICO|nr:glycosyltransferase [Myceligenerans xiligouense]RPF20108.1 glycosyl transferase family 1 [Myceligenerans xiligouense]